MVLLSQMHADESSALIRACQQVLQICINFTGPDLVVLLSLLQGGVHQIRVHSSLAMAVLELCPVLP